MRWDERLSWGRDGDAEGAVEADDAGGWTDRMLLQTNSYLVPKDRRAEHARLMRRFRQALAKLGCDDFEVYEKVGANWGGGESTGQYVQIMRFRGRQHQMAVQNAEKTDPAAQTLIKEFCDLVNLPYQQQQGFFTVGFFTSVLPPVTTRLGPGNAGPASEPMPGTAPEASSDPLPESSPDGGDESLMAESEFAAQAQGILPTDETADEQEQLAEEQGGYAGGFEVGSLAFTDPPDATAAAGPADPWQNETEEELDLGLEQGGSAPAGEAAHESPLESPDESLALEFGEQPIGNPLDDELVIGMGVEDQGGTEAGFDDMDLESPDESTGPPGRDVNAPVPRFPRTNANPPGMPAPPDRRRRP